MVEWQPIATAPKNETVLTFGPGGLCTAKLFVLPDDGLRGWAAMVGTYALAASVEERGCREVLVGHRERLVGIFTPTHWMRPEPPSEGA